MIFPLKYFQKSLVTIYIRYELLEGGVWSPASESLEALRYAVNIILHDVPVCKMFSQCQWNIVRSLSCYNATVRMSLHQPNVTLIYPADSERQQKPTWDVFPFCDWQVSCNPCGFTPEIHSNQGGPHVIWTDLAKLICRVRCSQPATGVLNTPYPVSLNLLLLYFTTLWANYRSIHKWQFILYFFPSEWE